MNSTRQEAFFVQFLAYALLVCGLMIVTQPTFSNAKSVMFDGGLNDKPKEESSKLGHKTTEPVVAPKPQPIIVRVTGYAAFEVKEDMKNQQSERLKSIRASKLDAYRTLAERVYGISLSGNSRVDDFGLTEDEFSSVVRSFVRGARVISISENPKTGIETVLELKLPPNFHECLNTINQLRFAGDCYQPLVHRIPDAPGASIGKSEPIYQLK